MSSTKNFIITLFRDVIGDVTEEVDIREALAVVTINFNYAFGAGLEYMNNNLDKAVTQAGKLTARKIVGVFKKFMEVTNEITVDDLLTDGSILGAEDSSEPNAKRLRLMDEAEKAEEKEEKGDGDEDEKEEKEDNEKEGEEKEDEVYSDGSTDSDYTDEKQVKTLASFSKNPETTLMKELKFTIPKEYEMLDAFELEELEDCNINMKSAVDQFNATIASSLVGVDKLSEAGRYPFITPVLNEIVKNLDGIKHDPQHLMKDCVVSRGIPDWLLIHEKSGLPIFPVEGKVEIDSAAIAQVVLQLYEVYVKVRPKNCTKSWRMYGMVTTAVEVVFVKALFRGKRCRKVWRSKTFKIPHSKGMETEPYEDNVTPVIQYAVTMAKEQLSQLRKSLNGRSQ